ncbi:MAG TPA: amino acid adenylation domain-containing protein, partial [Herpetosiphonaceae bacterium]
MTQFSALIPAGDSSDPALSSLAGSDLAYWQAQLLHLPLVQIPADFARTKAPSSSRSSYPTALSPALSASLALLAASEQTTITQVCMAAFKVLLTYYINHEDIVIGTVLQEGDLHRTLVLRTDLSGNPSFREVVRRVTLEWEEVRKHLNIPVDVLRAFLQPQLDMLNHTLYQVMFSVYNQSFQHYTESPQQRACDLNYTIINDGETLIGYIDYNNSIFHEDTIKQIASYFEIILTNAVANSDQRIRDLLNVSDHARAALIRRRGASVAVNSQVLPAQLVERWAVEHPERLAITQGDMQLTYGAINARANQLAHLLKAFGIGPEARVAVCFERSCDFALALLAIFKAGGSYVPLDPQYPEERIMFMLADARVALILSDEHFAPLFAHFDGPVITNERAAAAIASQPTTTPTLQATAHNLAYIIYTSGSTGRPKGVMVTYASLLNLINWHTRAFDLTPDDRATLIASPAFDASVWELWPSLAAGATIAIPDDETRITPEALRDWLVQTAITITFLPTPLAEQLLALDWPHTAALRLMLTGGDTLHHYPAADLPFTLINNYGPTETTVVATSGPIILQARNPATPSIGRLIDNSDGYVLNHALQLVPIGIPGELYLGGTSLARGYLDRPEITAERFIPDPFSGRPGDRLYRTGDIVRYRTNGDIEYLGRADGQVKIRGHRIELGEIKVVLNDHPDVTEAAVVVHGSGAASRLVGYVVPRKDALIDGGALQEWVRDRVPAYMVPAAVVLLDGLPLTPNGKLDRRALPEPTWQTDTASPRNEREQRIAAIWQAVLGIDTISIYDHFFHIGGHSLLATQMLARVKEAFQIDLSFRILFEHPTVAGLAEVIADVSQSQPDIVIGSLPRPAQLPLSAAQQRLWFLEQLTPGTAMYNVPLAYELRGALDRAALQQSLDGLVTRHEILRTTFALHDGAPIQQIHTPGPVAIQTLDGTALADPDAALAHAARQPFDLAAGPLFRVVLAPLGPASARLLFVFHHS